MKAALAIFAVIVTLGVHAPAQAEDRTATVRVRNMTCALCPIIVERAIQSIPGVKEIAVSAEAGTATVVYNDRATDPTEIAETIAHAGYPAWPMKQ